MADLRSKRFMGNSTLQAAANNSSAMRRGERDRAAVRLLQEALVDLGIRMPRSTKIEPILLLEVCDGIYGDETEQKVAEFQSRYGLVQQNGIVGEETMSKLDSFFLQSDSLIRTFLHEESDHFGGRVSDFGHGRIFHIGSTFNVLAVFVRDTRNQYQRLEYRQEIRGQTLVDGVRANLIGIYASPAINQRASLLSSEFQEDGGRFVGPYGYRRGEGQVDDWYLLLNPETLALIPDTLRGDVYHSSDSYGLRLTQGDCDMYHDKRVEFHLVFKGEIRECATPGGPGSPQPVREITWTESGSFIVPRSF